MQVSIFNKVHFPIKINKYTFEPFREQMINISSVDSIFREIRSCKYLRIGKHNNKEYMKKHKLKEGSLFNFIYDNNNQHTGNNYKYAIQALSKPIIKYLNDWEFNSIPLKKINIRFFSSLRINQLAKSPVGPNDVFMSHGIGDKNYWIGDNIKDYKFVFAVGKAWEERMRKTGYKGEIFLSGYTKLDPLINGDIKKTEYQKPFIVWAPTHGYSSKNKGRSSYPQCLDLIQKIPNDYIAKIALHPTSKVNKNEKQTPTLEDLLNANVVIADAGSTLYEAWILGKPVIFPDWICQADTLNHFKKDPDNFEYQIYDKQIGYHAKNMNELNKMIEIALTKGMKDESKEFIEKIYPEKIRGKAGEKTAYHLKEIANYLNLK